MPICNRYLLAAFGASLFSMSLRADCVGGTRPATEAEKKFTLSNMTGLKSSLPPAPAGWTVADNTRIAAPVDVCAGMEKSPNTLRYQADYTWVEGEEVLRVRRAEERRRIDELRALQPEEQKQSDELYRRGRELDRASRKATAAGNKPEADRLGQESTELIKQSVAIRDAHMKAVNGKLNALSQESQAAEKMTKTQVRLEFVVNASGANLTGETTRPAYANIPLALRSGETTLLAFGAWKVSTRTSGKTSFTSIDATLRPGVPATTVQSVLVKLSGTPKQVDDVVAALDAGSVMRLLNQ